MAWTTVIAQAAPVAAVVSFVTTITSKLYLDRRAHRDQLEIDYQYEQRKALRSLIGRHHGMLLDHATSWHNRMSNIYANCAECWLDVGGEYARPSYYFDSTIYRFLSLQAHAQLFEDEQVFIDSRVVGERDLDFVKFVKALHWVMSDVAIYDGLEYDKNAGRDHFMSDRLRAACEAFAEEGRVPSYRTFQTKLKPGPAALKRFELAEVCQFFDGVSPVEPRLRWDRLVCLHLIVIAFVRAFGYEWLRPTPIDVTNAASKINNALVAQNMTLWLPRLGLANHEESRDVRNALQQRAAAATRARRGAPAK